MFFNTHRSPFYGYPSYYDDSATSSFYNQARVKRELEAREDALLDAKDRLVAWQKELERRQLLVESRERALESAERHVREETVRLQKRVCAIDNAESKQATIDREALETTAATVIQRAVRRLLAKRCAAVIVSGLRILKGLEENLAAAQTTHKERPNSLLLSETLTKLLEQADGIETHGEPSLRRRRKQFVRTVMRICEDPERIDKDDDTMSDDCSDDGSTDSQTREMAEWVDSQL